MRTIRWGLAASAFLIAAPLQAADSPPRDQLAFFEKKIRPVLAKQCYECHSIKAAQSGTLKGELQLDTRKGVLAGGESGPAVVAGQPDQSTLIRALKHLDFEMPPKKKLPDAVIADFERWVTIGVPDWREGEPAAIARGIDYEAGRKHWALQPLKADDVPSVRNRNWPAGAVDRYILAGIEKVGLQPAEDAPPLAVLRRLCFDLTGLPPSLDQVKQFESLSPADAAALWETLITELIDSPRFGEHWARHWLDGIRYDPVFETSAFYRNWVIKALNDDMPYDAFVRRQLAGDLMTADSEQEAADNFVATQMLIFNSREADFVEASLEVVGQQLLGMSFNCAKCHDHKFDAISQEDYYALAGILTSSKVPKNARDGMTIPGTSTKIISLHEQEEKRIGPTRFLHGGERNRPGDLVPRRLPNVFFASGPPRIESSSTSGRLELARWIGAPNNPLTARVAVNRIWQRLMGRGIVRTPNDFGANGEAPTHPRLLDHLATRLVDSKWSLKSVIREVASSRTYCLALKGTPDSVRRDYDNKTFSRANAKRLQYEQIMDQLFSVAGQLELGIVAPPEAINKWPTRRRKDRTYGGPRTIYVRPDGRELQTFDGANSELLVVRRSVSVTAPQMMYFLNGNVVRELCKDIEKRVSALADAQEGRPLVDASYRLLFSRPPTNDELELGVEFIQRQSLQAYVHALLCANEFVYLN